MESLSVDLFIRLNLSSHDAARLAATSTRMAAIVYAAWCASGITVHQRAISAVADTERLWPITSLTLHNSPWWCKNCCFPRHATLGKFTCLRRLILRHVLPPAANLPALRHLEMTMCVDTILKSDTLHAFLASVVDHIESLSLSTQGSLARYSGTAPALWSQSLRRCTLHGVSFFSLNAPIHSLDSDTSAAPPQFGPSCFANLRRVHLYIDAWHWHPDWRSFLSSCVALTDVVLVVSTPYAGAAEVVGGFVRATPEQLRRVDIRVNCQYVLLCELLRAKVDELKVVRPLVACSLVLPVPVPLEQA